ncbi:hypothetical protein ACK3TF_002702 [Chlorella vulgaris]
MSPRFAPSTCQPATVQCIKSHALHARRSCASPAPARRPVATAGEGRSANRTKWASGDLAGSEGTSAAAAEAAPAAVLEPPAGADGVEGGEQAQAGQPEPQLDAAELVWAAADEVQPLFADIDRLVHGNLKRVQQAMRRRRIGPHHFAGSTGYGHGDLGRAALDEVFAEVMGAEAAAVRIQYVSGTHAISSALFGCLRPGDELLAVAGSPYDTLEEVIGLRGTPAIGSLRDFGVTYRKLDLAPSGSIDWEALASAVRPETKVALVQRSCGYALRPTLRIDEIERAVAAIKAQNPDVIVAVDNCYGEFTDSREPPAVGADLCMGSLIKNGGGTIVSGGGYVAGRADLVERALARLTAPGIGTDAGCVPGETLRLMFQGLWLAPQMVGEALKGGRLAAEVLQREGYNVIPAPGPCSPWSFITAVELGSKERMVAFCRAVQQCCPIGSYIQPVPGVTPGYGDEVIFADGTFIDGSTAELSADGPIRPPYVVYCQGGTHWTHWAYVLESAVAAMREAGAAAAGKAQTNGTGASA